MKPIRFLLAAAMLTCGMASWCAAVATRVSPGHESKAEPSYPVIPLLHTRWLASDGAPPNINQIAQTPDGWLWVSSTAGLHRFDGVSFTRFRPPGGQELPNNIQRLGTLRDGRLWVAPRFGGLYLIKGEEVQAFGPEDSLPKGHVKSLSLDRKGRLWLASGKGLHVLDRDARKWRHAGKEFGLPGSVVDVLADRAGAVWVQTADGNFCMLPDEKHFSLVASQDMPAALLEAPDGTVWSADPSRERVFRVSPGKILDKLERLLQQVTPGDRLGFDRRGDLWIPQNTGMVRVTASEADPQIQVFAHSNGLSGQRGLSIFEDREGNVWGSTDRGLDQFRRARIREISLPSYAGEAPPLATGPEGVWINRSFLRAGGDKVEAFGPAAPTHALTTQLYRDRHGVLWSGGFDGIWRSHGEQRTQLLLPEELRGTKRMGIFSIAMDKDDGLWVSFGPRGTWRWKDGVWTRDGGIAQLAGFPPTTIVSAPDGSLWFGTVGSRVAIRRDGRVRIIGAADGLNIGTVLQILPGAGGAWLSGDEGLAWFDGSRAIRILGEGGEHFTGATGLVAAPDGGLWANAARGLVVLPAAELRQALASPGYPIRYRRYDENDGLRGLAASMLPLPSMVRAPTGELIISTTSGVFSFDPERAPKNPFVPAVHVTGISASGRTYSGKAAVTLPASPNDVRVDYTALSLSVPQRVRFRYMLEGVDAGWQDAGGRRTAFYTRLDPGHYVFRVKASNDDGLWNEEGASLRFEVPPTIVQTIWFKIGCALALLLAAFALHRLRLRMALRRQSRVFETRVAERERIARDLHDTLLQSVQGLIMHFRRIALKTPDDAPTRPLMQEALAMATEVLEEGRDRVGSLRTPTPHADLAILLDAHGQRLAGQHPARFSLHKEGQTQRLRAPVLDEVLAIGREAVRNAFLHAEADLIEVTLRHGERDFEMVVTDDGAGIEPAMQAGRPGHWGICGMRERAAELGATLDLRSAPGEGSTWSLRLPARLAYADDSDVPFTPATSAEREGELQ